MYRKNSRWTFYIHWHVLFFPLHFFFLYFILSYFLPLCSQLFFPCDDCMHSPSTFPCYTNYIITMLKVLDCGFPMGFLLRIWAFQCKIETERKCHRMHPTPSDRCSNLSGYSWMESKSLNFIAVFSVNFACRT